MSTPDLHPCHAPGISRLSWALQHRGAAIDSSETGTGKTWRALGTCKALGSPAFVICLKGAKAAWREAAGVLGVPITVVNYEEIRCQKNQGLWIGGKKGQWAISKDRVFIFDESHKLNGKGTWNSIYAVRARSQGYKVLLLSATPASSPLQLRAQGYVLGLHQGSNFFDWLTQFGMNYGYYGGFGFTPDKERAAMQKIGDVLYNQNLSYSIGLREIVAKGFPDNNIDVRKVEAAGYEKIQSLYAELAQVLADLEAKKEEAVDLLTIQLRLRQEIELLKVPELAEITKEILENSNKSVIIFVNFRDTALSLDMALRPDKNTPHFSIILGGQTEYGRRHNLDLFNYGRHRVLISTVSAGGTSINLHDTEGTRPRHVLMCPTYSAPDMVQALGRAHRLGSKSPTQQQICFVAGTTEEYVYRRVKQKIHNISQLTNNDLLGL
jgi:Helicase conserved C-terminal domain